MSDRTEQEISQLLSEIEVLRQQKTDIIAEYGEKAKALTDKIKALKEEEDRISKGMKSIESANEEAANIIKAAERTANEIYRATQAERAKIQKEADEQAQQIILDAKSIMAEAEGYMVQAREAKANGARFEVEMRDALQEAQDMKADAGIVNTKLREKEQSLRAEAIRVENLRVAMLALDKNIQERQAVLELNEGSLKERQAILENKILELDEAIKKADESKQSAMKTISEYNQMINTFNQEKSALLESLAKTKEINAWRSKELDLGFEKLKNDQATLRADQNKIKEIQKTLQK